MKSLKILILSHISELLGGAERSMLDIVEYWAKHYGVKPEFILREPVKSLGDAITQRGWKHHPLQYTFWSDGNPPTHPDDIYRNWQQNETAIKKIEQIIKQTKPDVVMTNSVVCPWAALAAYNQKIPHVWFVREYGDLDHGRIFEIGRKKTLEDVGNLSAVVFTNSKTLAAHVSKYIDKRKVFPLYTPLNIKEIQNRATNAITSPYKSTKSLKLILTGNIARSKGQLETIQAVGKLNDIGHDVELCLVGRSGDKQLDKEIEDTINKLSIKDKVHFVGYQANLLPFVRMSDVGIMPSRMEAFGRVTFEYLALATPVVGANSGATPEMVKDAVNGYLFKVGDVDSLTNAITHYANNRKLIKPHGQAGLKIAEEMMRSSHNVDNAYKQIKQALNNYQPTHNQIHFLEHRDRYAKLNKRTTHTLRGLPKKTYRHFRHKAKQAYINFSKIRRKF